MFPGHDILLVKLWCSARGSVIHDRGLAPALQLLLVALKWSEKLRMTRICVVPADHLLWHHRHLELARSIAIWTLMIPLRSCPPNNTADITQQQFFE
jgi:hypothetical protein